MIREITEKDREIYLELAREFYTSPAVAHAVPDSYLVNTFEVLVRGSEYARGYMLESDGEAGGYALLAKTYSQEAGGCVLWVEEVYLRPEFRSKGLGGEFFSFLRENLTKDVRRIRLEVEPENERAAALYKRLGYEKLPYAQMVLELPDGE